MRLELIDSIEEQGEHALRTELSRLRPREVGVRTFREILLQRQWLSYSFTPIYDIALNLLTERAKRAKPIIRRIIREEYPDDLVAIKGETPSHREDLVTDLLHIGVTPQQFRASRPTPETQGVIEDAFAAITEFSRTTHSDLMLLAFLRFWGEVLPAIEYDTFWPRISKLLGEKYSVFYQHHMTHDRKACKLSAVATDIHSSTHADNLGRALAALIIRTADRDETAISSTMDAVMRSAENKVRFYRQFASPSRMC